MSTQTLPLIDERRRDLTALDRCDSCGAKAWVRVVLAGSELFFCAHHAGKHMAALEGAADYIQDDRSLLLDEEN